MKHLLSIFSLFLFITPSYTQHAACTNIKLSVKSTQALEESKQKYIELLRRKLNGELVTAAETRPVKVVFAHMSEVAVDKTATFIVEQAGRMNKQYSTLENMFELVDIVKMPAQVIRATDSLDALGLHVASKIYSLPSSIEFNKYIFETYRCDVIVYAIKSDYAGPAGTTFLYTAPEGWAHPITLKLNDELLNDSVLGEDLDANLPIENWTNKRNQLNMVWHISVFGHEWSHAFNGSAHSMLLGGWPNEPTRHAVNDTAISTTDTVKWQTITGSSRSRTAPMIMSSLHDGPGYAISEVGLPFNLTYQLNPATYTLDPIDPIPVFFGTQDQDNFHHPNGLDAEDYLDLFLALREDKTTSTNTRNDFGDIQVYPNPIGSNETLTIAGQCKQDTNIKLIDLFGRTITQTTISKGEHTCVLTLPANLTAGYYALMFERKSDQKIYYTHLISVN